MNKKGKGTCAERDLIHKFWGTNVWVAHRIAGSGSSKYPSPDIIASNNIRKLAIECKCSKIERVYIPKKEIEELKKFGEMFGAETWLGFKFSKIDWLFLAIDDLHRTEENYSISIEKAKTRGLLFEELID